ncbi:hypothetical protein, partial [Bacillus subtilis]|uniref:hypothetical protein n=1 Tax=Bacillus subtilis TaxID=1423 RepID=UPI002DBBB4BA
DEYLKKLYKTKKLVEKTSFSLQAESHFINGSFYVLCKPGPVNLRSDYWWLTASEFGLGLERI